MDQIFVHLVLAGNPGKTWEQILPELQTLNLSPASLIAQLDGVTTPEEAKVINLITNKFGINLDTLKQQTY